LELFDLMHKRWFSVYAKLKDMTLSPWETSVTESHCCLLFYIQIRSFRQGVLFTIPNMLEPSYQNCEFCQNVNSNSSTAWPALWRF